MFLSKWPTKVLCHYIYFITVDADEIRRLGKRFRKLDLDNSGALSIDEFMSLPELQQNPLVQRVIDIFDADGNGEVDFKGMHTLLICLIIVKAIIKCPIIYQMIVYIFQLKYFIFDIQLAWSQFSIDMVTEFQTRKYFGIFMRKTIFPDRAFYDTYKQW